MNNRISLNHRAFLPGMILLMLIWSIPLHAQASVGIDTFDASNQLNNAGQISASARFGLSDSYTGNVFLDYSAWGVNGSWFAFQNQNITDVTITVTGDAGFVPGVTVWATGAAEFDGGTLGFASEFSTAGFSTPLSFNATGAMGAPGTLWMASGHGGNAIETLAYAVANPNVNHTFGTGWGETILSGVHDISLTDTFEAGISGNTDANAVALQFNSLAAGWYALYIGGADTTTTGGNYDLIVSAVPENEIWAMLLAGLGLIGWRLRNQSATDGVSQVVV
ncbi:MAG: pyruvate-binding protein [Burkholderiales bacterium]|nr:pyruvate-binding protein [Burkholderiales bacterium]MCP5252805.1 pyruvate-binding protein [Burkholderiales bacterium]